MTQFNAVSTMLSVSVESFPRGICKIYTPRTGDHYIAGDPGAHYSIRVHNLTSGRIEMITSVDGRNTLQDEEADVNANTGLVIPAFGSYEFRGWRVDDETVRDFIFGTDLADSVAYQSGGDVKNKGVIGIAAWQEKMPAYRYQSPNYGTQMMRAGGQSVSGPVATANAGSETTDFSSDMSTGIGEARRDVVGRTSFVRGSGPDVIAIRYASYESLKAAGVISPETMPDPFPGSSSEAGGYSVYRKPGSC